MSQSYKFKFEEMRDNDPTGNKAAENANRFYTESNVRNLCFVWPDGRKEFLNYAYLVGGRYSPNDSTITLIFTTDIVTIKGSGLKILFDQLFEHAPKQVVCTDSRYNAIEDGAGFIVNEILIVQQ